MQMFLATNAADWLEQRLFPIAISAARLPEGTTLDDVLNLHLSQPDHASYAHSMAVMHCASLHLLSVTLIATELAQNERATQIAQCIIGLMWRDAFELAIARDLDFDSGTAGFPTAEFELRHDVAQEIWERWQQTDAEVGSAAASFFQACGDAWDEALLV
jgi:hypothetical protein